MKVRNQQYRVEVRRIVDGDTLDVIVHLGFEIFHNIRVRLADIDTPETYRPSSELERESGKTCKNFLETLVSNKELYIRSYGSDIYSRYTCDLFYNNNGELVSVNEAIKEFMVANRLEKQNSP